MYVINENNIPITAVGMVFVPYQPTYIRSGGMMSQQYLMKGKLASGQLKMFPEKHLAYKYKTIVQHFSRVDPVKDPASAGHMLKGLGIKDIDVSKISEAVGKFRGDRSSIFRWVIAIYCGCQTDVVGNANHEFNAARAIMDTVPKGELPEGDPPVKEADKAKLGAEVDPKSVLGNVLGGESTSKNPFGKGMLENVTDKMKEEEEATVEEKEDTAADANPDLKATLDKADKIAEAGEEEIPGNESEEEIPAEEASEEEVPVEETPAEETLAEDTPAEETPAEDTPAEEPLVEEVEAKEDVAVDIEEKLLGMTKPNMLKYFEDYPEFEYKAKDSKPVLVAAFKKFLSQK